jgi:hypothetical protein
MSTRIQPANAVRVKFEQLSQVRTEKLVDMTIAFADRKLTAYFEERLNASLDPYPPPDHKVTLTVIDASDFASGNDPEAQGAWEHLSPDSPDGKLLIKRLHEELTNAGFEAKVSIDKARNVSVTISDPQFTTWFKQGHDVGAVAADQARHKFLVERAAPIVAPVEAEVKKKLREALAEYEGSSRFTRNYGGVQGQVVIQTYYSEWKKGHDVDDEILRFAFEQAFAKTGVKDWILYDMKYGDVTIKFTVSDEQTLKARIASLT